MTDCAVDFDVDPISKIVCKTKTNKQASKLTLQLFIILIKPITTTTRLLKSHGVGRIIDSLWRSLWICIKTLLSVVYTKKRRKYFKSV